MLQQKLICSSGPWSSKSRCCQGHPVSAGARVEPVPHPSRGSRSWAQICACRGIRPTAASVVTWSSPCASESLLIRTVTLGEAPTLQQYDLISTLSVCRKPVSAEVHAGSRGQDVNVAFEETQLLRSLQVFVAWKAARFYQMLFSVPTKMIVWLLSFITGQKGLLYLLTSPACLGKIPLGHVSTSFNTLLHAVSKYFFEHFCFYIHKGYWSVVFFSHLGMSLVLFLVVFF